jgi:GT2 family glycosyltransferase
MGPLDLVANSFVDIAREELAQRFVYETDEPYLLFVDSDHSFERKDAEMLLTAMESRPKLGICSGLTVFRDGSYKPVVQWFQPTAHLYRRARKYMQEKCIKEVDYVGTGFTMIRREVFLGTGPHPPLDQPFFRVYHDNKKNFWGEDVHFVRSVKAAGWKVAVHFGTNVGHIGSVDYKPRDLLELPEPEELEHAI